MTGIGVFRELDPESVVESVLDDIAEFKSTGDRHKLYKWLDLRDKLEGLVAAIDGHISLTTRESY